LCDDALQHHALHKDINLLVIDGDYGLGNGHLLPAGPLRENLRSALKRVSGVILIGDDKHAIAAKIPEAMPLFNANIAPVGDLSFLHLHPLIAFAGIARPEKFFASLAQLHAPVVAQHIFADHHPYSAEELQALQHEASERGAWLITTEKDWVRLPQTVRAYCHSLPVALHLQQPELMQQFLQNQLVGKVDKAHV
jgi:tetraacyldisaccharide 4'-kinase